VGAQPQLPDRVDALVAGAGPAGLTASLRLADAGAAVLLVDARRAIGSPIRCGEVTFEDVFKIIGVEPRPEWIRKRGVTQEHVRRSLLVLDRAVWERDLARLAAERGAVVRSGTSVVAVGEFDGRERRVTLLSAGGERRVRARCVIAADGVSSTVARLAGIDTYLPPHRLSSGLARIVEGATLAAPDEGLFEPLPPPFPAVPYYFWVIPHGRGRANVGLYLPGRDGARARAVLQQMLERTEAVEGGRVVQTVVGIIPDTPPLERPYADGIAITGGAARMILPLSAGGIAPAVISGKHAAQTLIDLGQRSVTADALAPYRTALEPLYSRIRGKWNLRRSLEHRLPKVVHG
jgi:digeranylgeranylglycerophospholipid reductase